jgi:hypothetical protein
VFAVAIPFRKRAEILRMKDGGGLPVPDRTVPLVRELNIGAISKNELTRGHANHAENYAKF